MASSVSASAVISQATKRTHAEMSSSEISNQQNSSPGEDLESKVPSPVQESDNALLKSTPTDTSNTSNFSLDKKNSTVSAPVTLVSEDSDSVKQQQESLNAAKVTTEITLSAMKPTSCSLEVKLSLNGTSAGKTSSANTAEGKETKKATSEHIQTSSALTPSSQLATELRLTWANSPGKSTPEPMETSVATASQDATAKSDMETAASQSKSAASPDTTAKSENAALQSKSAVSKTSKSTKLNNTKPQLEDGEEPEKKCKIVSTSHSNKDGGKSSVSTSHTNKDGGKSPVSTSNTNKDGGKSPDNILDLMDKTFEQRRKVVTKQMPSIPELKELYPDLFTGKQLLLEFQRITKIDIDQKIQEFCVRYATAVIEMARNKKGAAPVLARWEQAKQENDTLRQYWDMVTALCLLPLHFGENFVEMVMEIGEDEEVVPQGKIVPTLVARGNIFRTDEFFLIAENTIVQEFEEFTIAFASLYSSYWVFNMVYPETIENTYNYIQRCIVRQREPGAVPLECKNFTKTLLKWNKGKDGK